MSWVVLNLKKNDARPGHRQQASSVLIPLMPASRETITGSSRNKDLARRLFLRRLFLERLRRLQVLLQRRQRLLRQLAGRIVP